ncbi:MAG TPA: kinase/pyrophosphorylase [Firmicutes bacterium]|nr:kinase/pyrophosphorylase [Bacillota bacterium]
MNYSPKKPVVYIVSDSIGETAEFVVKAVASQYDSGNVEIRRVSYVSQPERIVEVMEEAELENGMVAYTLVLPELRKTLEQEAERRDIPAADIMGPTMKAFARIIGKAPYLEPGRVRRLGEEYFRRIAAVEFAVKYDDGKDPRGILLANVVLIGVSRTSKTPLSMYLANRRLLVANLPLVPEVEPPEELFWAPSANIIGLTVDPHQLKKIRRERLNSLGLDVHANYASMERIVEELEYARKVMKQVGCIVFDVSNMAVEEVATQILQVVKEGDYAGN